MDRINMDNFKSLLVDYYKTNKKLPNVTIKDNSSLYEVLNALSLGNIDEKKSGISQRNRIKQVVGEFTSSQDEDSFFSNAFDMMDNIADVMSNKIIETKTNLTTIHATVESLSKEITNTKNNSLAKDPWTSRFLNKTEFNEDYNMVPWDSLLSYGNHNTILISGNDFADTPNSDSSNNNTLMRIKNRLNFNYRDNGEYFDLDLSKELKSELVEIVKNSVPNMDIPVVEKCINVLTKSSTGRSFMNKILKVTSSIKTRTEGLVLYLSNIDTYSKVLDCVEQVSDDVLSDESKTQLHSNIKNVKEYLLFMSYWSLYTKENTFKDTLVLPNKMVNPDNFTAFETDGGSQLQISHYLYIKYPNDAPLPLNGLSGKFILDTIGDVNKRVEADQLNIGMKVKKKTIIAEKNAVSKTLTKYITTLTKDNPELNLNKRDMLGLINNAGDTIALNNDKVDDVLYRFIVSNVYRNSFIYTAYQKLGIAYSKQLQTTSEISNEDLTIINNSIFTELVVDYIKDNFLEVN